MADPVYLNEPQRASDYVHQICILMGIVVPDPDFCADEENRLTYLIALLLDNWGGGGSGGGTFWSLDGNNTIVTKDLGTTSNQDFNFISNNTDRGTVFKTGEFMWGATAAPTARFHSVGSGITGATKNFYTQNLDNSYSFSHYDNGRLYRNGALWSREAGEITTIGVNAGASFTIGDATMVGAEAGMSLVVGNGLTAVGAYSLRLATISSNTGLGGYAGRNHTTGHSCTYVGFSAGYPAGPGDNLTGNYNTVIGTYSLVGGNFDNVLSICGVGTASNQIVIGGATNINNAAFCYYTDMYLGSGVTYSALNSFNIRATSATGTNTSAAAYSIGIIPPRGTGSAAGGSIILYYSPAGSTGTALNTPTAGYTLDNTGLSTIVNLKITALAASGSEIITVGNDGTVGKTSFTAKGDIAVYDGTNVTVFAAGSNDTLLSYDSATATGFKTTAIGTSSGTVCAGNDSRLPRIIVHAGDQAVASTVAWTGTTAPSGTPTLRYRWNRVDDVCVCQFRLDYTVAGSALTAVTINWPADMPNPGSISGWDNTDFGISVSGHVFTDFTANSGQKNSIASVKKDGSGVYQVVIQPNTSQNAIGCTATVVFNTDPS